MSQLFILVYIYGWPVFYANWVTTAWNSRRRAHICWVELRRVASLDMHSAEDWKWTIQRFDEQYIGLCLGAPVLSSFDSHRNLSWRAWFWSTLPPKPDQRSALSVFIDSDTLATREPHLLYIYTAFGNRPDGVTLSSLDGWTLHGV